MDAIEPTTPPRERLKDVYDRYFSAVPADSSDIIEQVYRMRYQVYCVERGFEPPNPMHPGLEIDEFDTHSVHSLLIHKPSGEAAGSVRLVLPTSDGADAGLPIQSICSDPLISDPRRFPVLHVGEVSRFCISKSFRRRERDRYYAENMPDPADTTRLIPHLTLGLMEQLVGYCIANGITYLCAEMEPAQFRLMSRLGIHFQPIGPLVQHHGVRQPCMERLDRLLDRVHAERPEVWDIVTDEGRHRPDAPPRGGGVGGRPSAPSYRGPPRAPSPPLSQ